MKTDNSYHTNSIVNIEKETPKVKNFILDTQIKAKPGQFVMVWLPRINEKPFGVVAAKPLTLSIANVGETTGKIHQLKIGDKLSWRGPYGTAFKYQGKKVLMVAGGYGVVPLYFLALSQNLPNRKKITVIIGARDKANLPFVAKFKKLQCQVKVCTDDGSAGFKGFTTQLAQELLAKESFDSIYTCGPKPMMYKIGEMANSLQIPCQISIDTFFKCGGLGLCGECAINGHLACQEGPVFDSKILLE
ncbi:dihydroorotate dehydrogenase electron transfer subunit [Candidatus Beckwithbacteria bacterium]|nr:dihydroorotate dehydrogenase electron transfer subunit [Candidatus Beckwithbacteria bacterium]